MKNLIIVFLFFGLSFSVFAEKAKYQKSSKRKPTQVKVMGNSKSEIKLILAQFQDKEGASIKLIKKIGNGRYRVDIESVNGHCDGNKVSIIKSSKGGSISFDSREYDCEK